jgi:dienelactone hydrolase
MSARYGWLAVLCLVALPAAVAGLAWAFYVSGNGLTTGAFALATVPLGLLVAPGVAVRGRVRLVSGSLLAAGLICDLGFVASRAAAVRQGPFVACVDGACTGAAPWIARVIREDETVFAGNALVEALGILTPATRVRFDEAARDAYSRLLGRTGGPGVNALLLRSNPERVTEVAWLPSGDEPVPGIVFLHGFGGLLTPYLSSITEAPELAGYAIVAPALGMEGDWWTDEGRAVVLRTLDTLPPRIDRDRLFLVGLSNGAVGASAVASDPELAVRFRAVVALMGASGEFGPPQIPFLLMAAEQDDRFEVEYLREVQGGLVGGAPVDLVVVPGDHFALFTETASVNLALAGWLAAR